LRFLEENSTVVLQKRLGAGIAVMASVFCILENFQNGSEAKQLPGQYVLPFFQGDKAAET